MMMSSVEPSSSECGMCGPFEAHASPWFSSTSWFQRVLDVSLELTEPALDLIEEVVKIVAGRAGQGQELPEQLQATEDMPSTGPIVLSKENCMQNSQPLRSREQVEDKGHAMRHASKTSLTKATLTTPNPASTPMLAVQAKIASETWPLPLRTLSLNDDSGFSPILVGLRALPQDFKVPPGLPSPAGCRLLRFLEKNAKLPHGQAFPPYIFEIRGIPLPPGLSHPARFEKLRPFQVCSAKHVDVPGQLAVIAGEDDASVMGCPGCGMYWITGLESELHRLPIRPQKA